MRDRYLIIFHIENQYILLLFKVQCAYLRAIRLGYSVIFYALDQ